MQCVIIAVNMLTRTVLKELNYLLNQYCFNHNQYLSTILMGLNPIHNNVKVQLNSIYNALTAGKEIILEV